MTERATTVAQYLAALPDDRKKALEAVRKVVKANLDPKVKEGIQYGMPAWFVPHSVYPDGYHCTPTEPLPFASVASQKNHMALYLFCMYCDPEEVAQFQEEWKATGKRLDMGKSCVRFKKLEDVPLDVIGRAVKRMTVAKFLAAYEAGLAGKKKPAAKKVTKKAATKARAGATLGAKKKVGAKKSTAKVAKRGAAKKATKKR